MFLQKIILIQKKLIVTELGYIFSVSNICNIRQTKSFRVFKIIEDTFYCNSEQNQQQIAKL